MLLLNTKELLDTQELTLTQSISGRYELISHHTDYYEPPAIDYTCNELKVVVKDPDNITENSVTISFLNATELDKAVVATTIDGAINGVNAASFTVVITNGELEITANTGSLDIDWVNSSAHLLFKKEHGVESVTGSSLFEFKDRTVVKLYEIFIDEALSKIVTSGRSTPTLIISSIDADINLQVMYIPDIVSILTLRVREHGSLVDLQRNDIPDIQLIFRKL